MLRRGARETLAALTTASGLLPRERWSVFVVSPQTLLRWHLRTRAADRCALRCRNGTRAGTRAGPSLAAAPDDRVRERQPAAGPSIRPPILTSGILRVATGRRRMQEPAVDLAVLSQIVPSRPLERT